MAAIHGKLQRCKIKPPVSTAFAKRLKAESSYVQYRGENLSLRWQRLFGNKSVFRFVRLRLEVPEQSKLNLSSCRLTDSTFCLLAIVVSSRSNAAEVFPNWANQSAGLSRQIVTGRWSCTSYGKYLVEERQGVQIE